MKKSISKKINQVVNIIISFEPFKRKVILASLDALLFALCSFLSIFFYSHNINSILSKELIWLIPMTIIIGNLIYIMTKQYVGITRFYNNYIINQLLKKNTIVILLIILSGLFFKLPMPPKSFWILLWLLMSSSTILIKIILIDFILNIQKKKSKLERVAIYGAGEAGALLSSSLNFLGGYSIIAFLDDNPDLWGRNINGIKIYPPQIIEKLSGDIDQILLAIPSLTFSKKKNILNSLSNYPFKVLQIPSIKDITSGKASIETLKSITLQDILSRGEEFKFNAADNKYFLDKIILVTGAGGSIGSEISRQLIDLNPQKIILLERNEPSLYYINSELENRGLHKIDLIPILGDAKDENFINKLFSTYNIDFVFHAAAYKHVPMVESNPLQGLENNTLSTKIICQACLNNNVKKVTLISSDKAVRPSNVMGASKRLSEIIFQSFSEKYNVTNPENKNTIFSIVRFGNVLGSSGSAIPLFMKQIADGGPLTITHPKMTRYFMSIEEASKLVIESTSFAKGGEIFLLDMGEPKLIIDIAHKLIKLSGLTLKNEKNPDGDIEIKIIGLRPGEKLFEELLIDGNSSETINPLIFKANENSIEFIDLWNKISALEIALSNQDKKKTFKVLKELVPEWKNPLLN